MIGRSYLDGLALAITAGRQVVIDATAAGWVWTILGGQMDLQAVLRHELGLDHVAEGLMAEMLAPGVIESLPITGFTPTAPTIAVMAPPDATTSAVPRSSVIAAVAPATLEIGVSRVISLSQPSIDAVTVGLLRGLETDVTRVSGVHSG